MKGERWTENNDIKNILVLNGSGPVVLVEDNKKYSIEGEGHVMILGVSGTGKSRRCTIPMTLSFLQNKESAIIIDPKGEIYKNTKGMIDDSYEVHVIDFRNLYKGNSEKWNPLWAPYELWKRNNPKDRFIAEQMVGELAYSLYETRGNDPFWSLEARNIFSGCVYFLFENAEPSEINLMSVYSLINDGDKKNDNVSYLDKAVEFLGKDSIAKMLLQGYVSSATETKAGLHSVFNEGLSSVIKNSSVRDFLGNDDISINDIKCDKPTVTYIILPDETPVYDNLAGVLVSQIMSSYLRKAEDDYNGCLPIKLNLLIEELGNVGKSIRNLPHLMSAGRSRNIRVSFVLQSISQLNDTYGVSAATTIMSNASIKIAFRVEHWNTLEELARMCGKKRRKLSDGNRMTEDLITPADIAKMRVGQMLVMIYGKYKYVTTIPDFQEIYGNIETLNDGFVDNKVYENGDLLTFDLMKFIKKQEAADVEEIINIKHSDPNTFDWMKRV